MVGSLGAFVLGETFDKFSSWKHDFRYFWVIINYGYSFIWRMYNDRQNLLLFIQSDLPTTTFS